MIVVEVRHATLNAHGRKRRTRRTTRRRRRRRSRRKNIKPNNPHLTGGEQIARQPFT